MIDPSISELHLAEAKYRLYKSLSATEQALVNERTPEGVTGFPPSAGFIGGLFANKYRVSEQMILEGSPLHASGDFRSLNSTAQTVCDPAMSAFSKKVFDLNSRSIKNLSRILDENGDGKVSTTEKSKGYSVAARLSRAKPDNDVREMVLHGVLGRSSDHELFVSDKHEEDLVLDLKKSFQLRVAAGALVIALGTIGVLGDIVGFDRLKKIDKHAQAAVDQASLAPQAQAATALHEAGALHRRCQVKPDGC